MAKTAKDCPESYKVVEMAIKECQDACKKLGITKFGSEEKFLEGEKCFVNEKKYCSQSGRHAADSQFVCKRQGNLMQQYFQDITTKHEYVYRLSFT